MRVNIGHKVRRQKATIKLHALDHFHSRFAATPFLDGNHTVLADLHKSFRKHAADRWIIVSSDGGDLLNFLSVSFVDRSRLLADRHTDRFRRPVDSTPQSHRVRPGGNHFNPLSKDRFGQHGGRRGAVASHVIGLAGRLLDKLGAEVFVWIFQFNIFSNRDSILRYFWRTPSFVQNRIASSRSQGAFDSPGKLRYACQ